MTTIPYAAAAAAPPTAKVLSAPQTYPPAPFPAAPVTLALTAPKINRTIPVKRDEYMSAMCAFGMNKYGSNGIAPPNR